MITLKKKKEKLTASPYYRYNYNDTELPEYNVVQRALTLGFGYEPGDIKVKNIVFQVWLQIQFLQNFNVQCMQLFRPLNSDTRLPTVI